MSEGMVTTTKFNATCQIS